MPNDIVERILMWKEIKDAQIIAEQALVNVFETNQNYEEAYKIMNKKRIEHEQIYSVTSMYAYNDAINVVDNTKKLQRHALKICEAADIMLQTARALI